MDASLNKDVLWQDITSEFKNSVNQLNLGELLKSDHFTLLEAMSAIELMDPRMDSGLILKKCNRKILNLDQSIRSGNVKINNLETDEILGIIDDTYCCLVTWFEGYPLAQTVMTNLYLHDPERIEDRCLRVFCMSALKLLKFIDKMVYLMFCIEEEDFFLNMGKFYLDSQVNDQKVLNYLDDLCLHYEKQLEISQNNTGRNHSVSQNSINNETNSNLQSQQRHDNPLQTNCNPNEIDKSQTMALINRLRFTYHFYACFLTIHKHILKDTQFGEAFDNQTDGQLNKSIKLVHNAVLSCDKHLEKCLEYLDRWNESIELGIKPSLNQKDLGEGKYPTIMGFEPMINLKLLPATYPRCPSIRSRSSTIKYLEDLILRLRYCISGTAVFNQKSLTKSLDFIESFSKYFRPSSCVISRTFLQILYLPNRSIKLFKEELLQTMTNFIEPSFISHERLDQFLTQSYKAFSHLITTYGHNPSRQHERFSDIISSYKNLHYENPSYIPWTTYILNRLCIKYVHSSLELELFSPHEYPYVFWYLSEILYKEERDQLEFARSFIENHERYLESFKKSKGKKSRRKQSRTSFHNSNLMSNEAFRLLSEGTMHLTSGLKNQGIIKSPVMEFTSEDICFQKRFGTTFGLNLTKIMANYISYKNNSISSLIMDHEGLSWYLYSEASKCFIRAKEIFSLLEQHQDCLKVCNANIVVTRILSSNSESFKDREVEFSFDIHPSFPTVKF